MRSRIEQKKEIFQDTSNSVTNISLQPHKLVAGKGLVPITGKQKSSLVFYKPDKELPIGMKLANNVKIFQKSGRDFDTARTSNRNISQANIANRPTSGGGY